MAKLYFTYSAMNAGKSAILLQAAYNYRERGMEVMLWTSGHYGANAKAKMLYGAGAVYHFKLRMDLILVWSSLQGELRHFFSLVIVQIMKSDT